MKNIIFVIAALVLLAPAAFASDITVTELHDRLAKGEDVLLVDVREPWEHQEFNIGGMLIPIAKITDGPAELKDHKNDEIVLYDRSTNRSGLAQMYLNQQGFSNVRHLIGGLIAWIEAYGKTLPTVTKPASTASTVPPQAPPAEVKEKVLFRSGAAKLVDEAAEWLGDLIDDEEMAAAITAKWKAREDLVGKTRTQILKLLLSDVKSLITDKAAFDAFVDGWNAKADPKP